MLRLGYSGNAGSANFAVEASRCNSAVAESVCCDLFGIGYPHLERNNPVGCAAVHYGFMAGPMVLPKFMPGWFPFGKYPSFAPAGQPQFYKGAPYRPMGGPSDTGWSDFRISPVFIVRPAGDIQRVFPGPVQTVQCVVDGLLSASADCPDDQLCLGRSLVLAFVSVGCNTGYAFPAVGHIST